LCPECGKHFDSGKAMGGHRRIHFQAGLKAGKMMKAVQGSTCDAKEADQVSEQPICCICERNFRSYNALFGHMKSHPERDWRGVKPPERVVWDTVLNREIDSSVTVRQVVNLMESIKGWNVTGKRGRESLADREDLEVEKEEEEREKMMKEEADYLLLLAHECFKDYKDWTKKQGIKLSQDENHYGRKVSTGTLKIRENRPSKVNSTNEIVRDKMDKGKGKKLADLANVGEIPNHAQEMPPLSHVCSICGKSFPSHQALGGHKGSHNKPKKIHTMSEEVKQVSGDSAEESRTNTVCVDHKCNKMVQTGMALGGHKGQHWSGPAGAESCASHGTSSPTEVSQLARRVNDFDLNEPAPDEDD
ncbi:zf-C2H2_6 domain-containing protein, partial [Cephalotus follicularis]